jgi:hypothetical protein
LPEALDLYPPVTESSQPLDVRGLASPLDPAPMAREEAGMDQVTRKSETVSNADGRGIPPEVLPYDGPATLYEDEVWDLDSELDSQILADLLRLGP